MSISLFFALYAAGLATFLSPCVLPLLPSYLAVLAGAEASGGPRPWRAGLGFALGLSAVFIVLGLGASALGHALAAHRSALMIVAGALMVLFGAKLAGALRLPVLDRDARPLLSRVPSLGGFWGGLLFGVAFSLGWTPCVGPLLGATLSYAASHSASPLQAAAQLAIYALGLSTPLIAATFAAGRVLELARRLRGLMLPMQRIVGAALVGVGLLIATDHLDLLSPRASATAISASGAKRDHCDRPETKACSFPENLADVEGNAALAIPLGRPHLVEFVSDHCTVCARMAPVVERLERACTQGDGSVVRVNVESPGGRALAQRFDVHAVPTFLQLDAEGKEVERVIGEQTIEQLTLALQSVRGRACPAL
jgi:cytochrome c-type biogenesis protein